MRLCLTVLLAIIWVFGHAQQSLQPNNVIEERLRQGAPFQSVELFQPALEPRSRQDHPDLQNASYLQLEPELRRELLTRRPEQLTLEIPTLYRSKVRLELYRVEPFAFGFEVRTPGAETPVEIPDAVFYRGRLANDPASLVAVSVFADDFLAMISTPGQENLVISRLEDHADLYAFYSESPEQQQPFDCHTADPGRVYLREQIGEQLDSRSANPCVRIYLEVDNDIYQDKGGTANTANYVAGVFNEAATLFANENIKVELSQIFIWDTTSPYQGDDIYRLLTQFGNQRTSFDGDLGQLLTYKSSGGIAYVNGICQPFGAYRLSVVSLGRTFANYPNYSFSVMAMTHEFGHLMGSQHTHACVWNGNGTAIDGCAGYTEGGCAIPGIPSGGGTIMSYCHLTGAGIDFTKGFGPQPGNVIRNTIANASCLQTCTDSGGDPKSGDQCQTVTFNLVLDLFGSETTWAILNAQGGAVLAGGPYVNKTSGQQIRESICLPPGCYTLEVLDTDGDGICCNYGQGSFSLVHENGATIAEGGNFGNRYNRAFCIEGDPGDPPSGDPNCTRINFNRESVISFGGSQDRGSSTVLDNGNSLLIARNAWKAIPLNYTITPNTVLAFEFRTTKVAEIHGIGFDNDNSISSSRTFQVHGTQNWGIRDFKNYNTVSLGEWKEYVIPVGQYYTGANSYLFFVADHDAGTRDGESQFRNVRISEGQDCGPGVRAPDLPSTATAPGQQEVQLMPNPAAEEITITTAGFRAGQTTIRVFNMMGQEVLQQALPLYPNRSRHQIDIRRLPEGAYYYRLGTGPGAFSGKFTVQR